MPSDNTLSEFIDHTALLKLAEAGMVDSTHVIGQDGGWRIHVKYGASERQLAASGGQRPRLFHRLEALADYLKSIGIVHFDVNALEYRHDPARPHNPVSAGAPGEDDEAAYARWLKAEIQEALDDPSPSIPHAEAMRQIRAAIKQK
jgi:hypothetical protein